MQKCINNYYKVIYYFPDESDGTNVTSSKAQAAIVHLNGKIERTKELIRLEQTIRDGMYFFNAIV